PHSFPGRDSKTSTNETNRCTTCSPMSFLLFDSERRRPRRLVWRRPAAIAALLIAAVAARPDEKSTGCITCHAGIEPMHVSRAVQLSCTDCHGGNGTSQVKEEAHVQPRFPELWRTSANPPRT